MTEVAKKSIQFVLEEVEYPISQELAARMKCSSVVKITHSCKKSPNRLEWYKITIVLHKSRV